MAKKKTLEPGKESVGEAMRLAVEALGPLRVDPDTAAEQLLALGEAYDEVERTRVALERKLDAAKTAKAAYEVAVDHVLGLVKTASHPEPLPLFDVQQAERDRAAMTGAADPKAH